jgi:hypothetical protein
MLQKTYRKYKHKGTLNISVQGRKRLIIFTPIGTDSFDYVTQEESVQKAMESHPYFKKAFYLVDEKEIVNKNTPEIQYEEVSGISDTKSAKIFFKERGIKCWSAANEDKCKEIASKQGIKFIDWN